VTAPAQLASKLGTCYAAIMQIQEQQMVVLLKGSLTDLKRARESLDDTGISAEIVRPPGCTTNS